MKPPRHPRRARPSPPPNRIRATASQGRTNPSRSNLPGWADEGPASAGLFFLGGTANAGQLSNEAMARAAGSGACLSRTGGCCRGDESMVTAQLPSIVQIKHQLVLRWLADQKAKEECTEPYNSNGNPARHPMRKRVDVISARQCRRQADLCNAEAHCEPDKTIQTTLLSMADQWLTLEKQIEWIAETKARSVPSRTESM